MGTSLKGKGIKASSSDAILAQDPCLLHTKATIEKHITKTYGPNSLKLIKVQSGRKKPTADSKLDSALALYSIFEDMVASLDFQSKREKLERLETITVVGQRKPSIKNADKFPLFKIEEHIASEISRDWEEALHVDLNKSATP